MQHSISDKQIIDCLKNHYGINVNALTPLSLGADINACIYKAATIDKSFYFVKIKYAHDHQMSIAVLELLEQEKIPLIIPLIKTKSGLASQSIEHASLTVQPFIEGVNGFSQMLTADQWKFLGKSLKKIHEIEIPSAIKMQLRQETFSSKWCNQVQEQYQIFIDNPSADIGNDKIAKKVLSFLKTNRHTIQRLVNRAEELAQKCQIDASISVLCHADLHAGNILINGENIYIIDWDDPMLAPKERDLMFIGGGVGNVWNKQNEAQLFYQGYGETHINKNLLAYYRYERIIEDIAVYVQELLLTSMNTKNSLEMYQHLVSQFDQSDVVAIAFATDPSLPM